MKSSTKYTDIAFNIVLVILALLSIAFSSTFLRLNSTLFVGFPLLLAVILGFVSFVFTLLGIREPRTAKTWVVWLVGLGVILFFLSLIIANITDLIKVMDDFK